MSNNIRFSSHVPPDVQAHIKNFYECANATFDPIAKLGHHQVISSKSQGTPGDLNFRASVYPGQRDASRTFFNTIARIGSVAGANLAIGSLQRTGKTLGRSAEDLALKYQKIMQMLEHCDPQAQQECKQLLDNATHLLVDALPKIKELLTSYLYAKITPSAGSDRYRIAEAIAKVLPYVSPQEFKEFSEWQVSPGKGFLDFFKVQISVGFFNMLEDLFLGRQFLKELQALDPYLSHEDRDLKGLYQLALVINHLEHFQRHPEQFAEIGAHKEEFYPFEESAPLQIPHYVPPEPPIKISDHFGIANRDNAFISQALIVDILNDAQAEKTDANSSLVQLLTLGSQLDAETETNQFRREIETALGIKLGESLPYGAHEVISTTREKIDIKKIKQALYDQDFLNKLKQNGMKQGLQFKSLAFAQAFGGGQLRLDYTPMPEGFTTQLNQLFGNVCDQLKNLLRTKPLNEQAAHYTVLKLASENRLDEISNQDPDVINTWNQHYAKGKTFDVAQNKHLPPQQVEAQEIKVADHFGMTNRDTAFIAQALIVDIMTDARNGYTSRNSILGQLLRIGHQIDQEVAGSGILKTYKEPSFLSLMESQLGVKIGNRLPSGNFEVLRKDPSKPLDITQIKKSLYTEDFLRKLQQMGKKDIIGEHSNCFKHTFGGNRIRFDYTPAPAPSPAPSPAPAPRYIPLKPQAQTQAPKPAPTPTPAAPKTAPVRAQAPAPSASPAPTPSPAPSPAPAPSAPVVKQQQAEPKPPLKPASMTPGERAIRPAHISAEEWNSLPEKAKASLLKKPYRKDQL
jgi:hypothetical protein